MELHLSHAISSSSSSASSCSSRFDPNYNINYTHEHSNKRKHGDYDDDNDQTMPLLVWGNFCCNKSHLINEEHQDHDGDGDDEVQSNYVFVHRRNEYDGGVIGWPLVKSCTKNPCHPKIGSEDGAIGWPPVKLCRKKLCHLKLGTEDGSGGKRSKSTYYKVHMEGIEIARKVDLNLHQSYKTLVPALPTCLVNIEFENVIMTYQDQEGDWLLARDVPWGSFINTVQRLKLRRK